MEPNSNLSSDLVEQFLLSKCPYTAVHSRTILLWTPSCFIAPCDSGVVSCIFPERHRHLHGAKLALSQIELLHDLFTQGASAACAPKAKHGILCPKLYNDLQWEWDIVINWRIWWTKRSKRCRTFWRRVLSSKKAQSWAEQSVLRKTREDADNCLKRALRIVSALLKSTQAFQNFSSFFTDQNPQNLQRVTRPTKRQCRPCPFKVLSMPAFLKLSPTAKSLHSEYRRAYILAFDTLSVCGQI